MAAYFAMRIETKYKNEGVLSAQNYYNSVFVMEKYKPFQADTDLILVAEGYGDVIPAAQ
ncbi:hypothetical protein [Desulforamulus aquiferis]|uniref:Uncharacterized protein n=1 Tax=Desulforamulus aquiferis TaxID=1397668 RepID=A0AAW7ZE85_9FIRM|nr:hypothetical protein [Desulforamulus aquiferis]MDO7787110.1 hypothetical protein [Desulforamulus aquiferis]